MPAALPSAARPSDETLIARRRALLGASYRLFYDRPVHLLRGEDVWLFDADGRRYLDAYNNVPCVGHAHPRVVEAVSRQMATLNTHTRYLHGAILDYTERLLATYPAGFGHVMYTCTGSEAVDLALRIARHETGGAGVVITRNAYHGTTAVTAGLSPLLGPAVPLGRDVWTVPAPDARLGAETGARLAADIRAAFADMRRHGVRPAAFLADSIFSTDGTRPEPAGFLKPAIEAVHEAGALYIADEVQPGFGRTGGHMWGFSRHGIVPDMAVMGKPMGNGLPIAGVALRPEVAERFGREVRYFNTFGANTVSIAAATAVLDVIETDRILARVDASGARLMAGLRALAERHPAIGDIRGAGLYIGVELVSDGAPDGGLARRVVNAMREGGVLIGASGPADNVLKIRPPLTFSAAHADLLLESLASALGEALSEEG
ncbi:aspartate aminotransferase family protein [Aureimonas endophytica]|uniref:Aspartate aminotransferase family protein n=1 Tax=Aureimonas endophytica TaxID=2027858 RepID=A0A917EBI3_9HYPH|nr:aspartate aminotransferase family protein [Aureimonas endophytica]GGE21295.1 aspartate aminotransferase family protein [Aureimonas endophytica]